MYLSKRFIVEAARQAEWSHPTALKLEDAADHDYTTVEKVEVFEILLPR